MKKDLTLEIKKTYEHVSGGKVGEFIGDLYELLDFLLVVDYDLDAVENELKEYGSVELGDYTVELVE